MPENFNPEELRPDEPVEGHPERQKKPRRRDFITKYIPRAAVGVVSGVAVSETAKNEVNKYKDGGVDTPEGFFTGIYEVHGTPLTMERMPEGTDALFLEESGALNEIIAEPERIIRGDSNRLPEQLLLDLSSKQIPIVYGDIAIDFKRYVAEEGGVPGAVLLARNEVINRLHKNPKFSTVNRRALLKAGTTIASLWAYGKVADAVMKIAAGSVPNEAARRVLSSLSDISTRAHPESETVFLRNAIMAEKLLTVGEYIKTKTGHKPNMAFCVGAMHSGIEDFLQAGPDFCRAIITAYPDVILRDLIARNGDTHAFSSAVLYQLPKDLTSEDIRTPDKSFAGLGAKSIVVTDTKLEHALNADIK